MSIEAMKQALEALELMVTPRNFQTHQFCQKAYDTLRQAIAEAEKQEPVSCPYCKNWATLGAGYYDQNCAECVMRMNHPPKRERVVFPTMLRKMWSGSEVQAWLDEHVNKENT